MQRSNSNVSVLLAALTVTALTSSLAQAHEPVAPGADSNAALQTPQIVEQRRAYTTPQWKKAFRQAVELANRPGFN